MNSLFSRAFFKTAPISFICQKTPFYHYIKVKEFLKNARENKEFTQKQVMELTGINKKSLSGYENNVAEPDLQTFATLINLYGLSADEVLEISTSTPSLLLSKKESSLLSTFNKLDFQHQEETLLLLRTLTKYLTKK